MWYSIKNELEPYGAKWLDLEDIMLHAKRNRTEKEYKGDFTFHQICFIYLKTKKTRNTWQNSKIRAHKNYSVFRIFYFLTCT